MQLSLLDELVWAASALLNLTLLLVLILRGRARSAPWFTALIAFGSLRTLILFLTYRTAGRHHAYFLIYWWAAAADLLLQITVVFEVAWSVFQRSGTWVAESRRRFLFLCALAPVAAAVLALTMKPAAKSALDVWDARAGLFMTTTICILCRAVMAVLKQLGLGWRARITRFMWGFMVWSLASFVTGTLHAYWRTIDEFGKLENTIGVVYQLVIVYWIVIFWLPEPPVLAAPVHVKEDLTRLAERIDYSQSRRS